MRLSISATKKMLLIFVAVLCIAPGAHACPDGSHYVGGQPTFLKEHDIGTVALLRNVVADEEVGNAQALCVLKESREYVISPRGRIWLVFNHRERHATTDQQSYVSVQIIKFFHPSHRVAHNLYFFRNHLWERIGDDNFNGCCFSKKLFARHPVENYRYSMKYFNDVTLHWNDDEAAGLLEFDKRFFGFKWHAKPINSQEHSWNYRYAWDIRDAKLLKKADTEPYLLENYLIRFRPTTAENTNKPVYFDFSTDNVLEVYIRTFSPVSPNFDNNFSFKINN